jgi:predicted aldo/keto reductase-like oxidoreductase
MDVKTQAGVAGLGYAAGKGLGVIVMEPVKGGRLASAPPSIQALWESAPVKRLPAEWALRFVWNDERVSTLLSGMSTMEQVVENVRVAAEAEAGTLARSELDLIDLVRDAYLVRTVVDCTACRYCLPCPQGIDIPSVFSSVNNAALFDDPGAERIGYQIAIDQGFTKPASVCEECGQCEERCPQQLSIIEHLASAVEILG